MIQKAKTHVLIVLTHSIIANLLKLYLQPEQVTMATSGEEAERLLKRNKYDLVISEGEMPDLTGDKFIAMVRQYRLRGAPWIILMSNRSEPPPPRSDYVLINEDRPLAWDELERAIDNA